MPENDILILKIRGLLPSLNPALKKIALCILNNPQKVKLLRIKDLASNCGVVEATVTRLVKTIGLGSFQELKINIAEITKERKVEEDLAIGICNSGRTISTVNALKRAKESGATTICITTSIRH